jgi:hypothetical protein
MMMIMMMGMIGDEAEGKAVVVWDSLLVALPVNG